MVVVPFFAHFNHDRDPINDGTRSRLVQSFGSNDKCNHVNMIRLRRARPLCGNIQRYKAISGI